MEKKFEMPTAEIMVFDTEDVITDSRDIELPIIPFD